MKKLGKNYVIPILIITTGTGWLLNVLAIVPQVDWIWTAALAVVGVLTVIVGGFDRLTIVIGPFLIISAIFSILRQTTPLSIEKELPILTVALGTLMLLAHVLKLPGADLLKANKKTKEESE